MVSGDGAAAVAVSGYKPSCGVGGCCGGGAVSRGRSVDGRSASGCRRPRRRPRSGATGEATKSVEQANADGQGREAGGARVRVFRWLHRTEDWPEGESIGGRGPTGQVGAGTGVAASAVVRGALPRVAAGRIMTAQPSAVSDGAARAARATRVHGRDIGGTQQPVGVSTVDGSHGNGSRGRCSREPVREAVEGKSLSPTGEDARLTGEAGDSC